MLRKENNRLVREYDSETLWIEPWGQNALRVRVTKMARMPQPDEEWALLAPESTPAEIEIQGSTASIRNGKITAQVTPAGKVVFFNQKGEVLLEEYHRNRKEAVEEFHGPGGEKKAKKW